MHAQSLDDHFEAEGFANPFGLGRAVERVNVDFDPTSLVSLTYSVSMTVNARSLLMFMEAVFGKIWLLRNNLK